jgi:hypothetical protein
MEQNALSFAVSATDPDGDAITYGATGLPPGASLSGATFSWVPQRGQAGTYPVIFTATDPFGATGLDSVTITILPIPPNDYVSAFLSWSASGNQSDLPSPSPIQNLYMYFADAPGFKGGEIDLSWNGTGWPPCMGHAGTIYKTSTTCTYLNRGSVVPVETDDGDGHYHVAWANNTANTSCSYGIGVVIQFDFSSCPDARSCFSLNSAQIIDGSNVIRTAYVTYGLATVAGGAGGCGTLGAHDPPDVTPGAATRLVGVLPSATAGATSIRFELAREGRVHLAAYAMNGRQVRAIADQTFAAGPHDLRWDGLDATGARVPAGAYVIRLWSDGVADTRRVTILR